MTIYTEKQLIEMALEMGMTQECATDMANEHIARRDETLPRYVRADLNASTGAITNRVCKFLDRKFGWNSENVHRIMGLYVNRNKSGEWYLCA